MTLTARQAKFVEAYVLDPNGKKAAIAAGYSPAGAEVTASKLLRHPKVAQELDRRRQLLAVRSGITAEMVLAEFGKVGFADIRQVVQWWGESRTLFDEQGNPVDVPSVVLSLKDSESLPPEVAAAIAEVSQDKSGNVKVKMHPKLDALVRIGQHLGMFKTLEPPKDEPLGKKGQADLSARNAQHGTAWDGLLQ